MSFIFDNQFQEDLEFLNEGKESTRKTQKNKDDVKEKKSIEKMNQIKVLNVNNLHNKLNEKCNGINNINVNNLLINNNINIENNNNIINNEKNVDNKERNLHTERLYSKNIENKLNNIPKANNGVLTHRSNKNIILIKDMKLAKNIKGVPLKTIRLTPQKANAFHSPSRLNKANIIKKQMLFPINKIHFYNKCLSPPRARTLNTNEGNKTFMNNSYGPNYKNLTQDMPETVCYFKLSGHSNSKFNPLNGVEMNPTKFNYFEGSIVIDNIFHKLKITQKSEQKYIGIDLKDIIDIQINEDMDKVIKIYNIYLKDGKNQENFDVNNFVSTNKEIVAIDMEQNDKIKAINCKFFIFSILMGKRFVPKAEFIFDNYDNFKSWLNCLQSVIKINKPDQDKRLNTQNI